jgi:lipopolysaccharide transport system permease protein
MSAVLAQPSGMRSLLPWCIAANLWYHRRLIAQFIRREIEGKYRGSVLGIFWSLATPLVMLAVYTFVFGIVFRARWPGRGSEEGSLADFAIVLFAGTTVFNIFSETVARAPGMVVNVPGYVKKVIFPLEILPFSVLGAALFNAVICLGLLVVLNGIMHGLVPWTLLLVPVVVAPVILLALGVSWFLSSLGVYLRDVSNIVGVVLQVLFFATPIFYPVSVVPESLRWLLNINPLTHMVEMFRGVCLFGSAPDPLILAGSLAIGLVVAWLGQVWFNVTRKGFADVL